MKHMTETQLNEYLDGALEASQQALMQVHLSDCAVCRARLVSLQTVFEALAALPEETSERDLTPSVLQALPHSSSGLGLRLVFAMQAGISLGLMLLFLPFMNERIAAINLGWNVRFAVPEVKFPNPFDFNFSLPANPLMHPSIPVLPVTITPANFSVWLILGCAAVLLFILGNFSLIFHNKSEPKK